MAPLQIAGKKPVQNMYRIHRLVTAMVDWHKKQLDLHCRVCGGRVKRARSGMATRQNTCLSQKRSLWSKMTIAHTQLLCVAHAMIPSLNSDCETIRDRFEPLFTHCHSIFLTRVRSTIWIIYVLSNLCTKRCVYTCPPKPLQMRP